MFHSINVTNNNGFCRLYSLQFCSFICQVASARWQRSDLCGLWVKLPLCYLSQELSTTSQTTQK